ncbi:MAG: nucleotide-binding protein [Ancrocorticia sp.]
MTVPSEAWVFDTGPLRHFATAGWLGALHFLAGSDHPVYIPDVVERELSDASSHQSGLVSVLDVTWMNVYRGLDLTYLNALATYENRLAVGRTNLGECGVLAMGETFGCTIIVDDAAAREIAEEKGLHVKNTVQLLCDGVRAKQLTLASVEAVADDLIASEYFLPFGPGGFRRHVLENGLLDYDDII